jgi:hypothetical protein
MFNKARYKVYKTTPTTEIMYLHKKVTEDEYGSNRYHTEERWKPFKSDLYYLEEPYNEGATFYSNFKIRYYPIAPSGKYNYHYGEAHAHFLRNMEHVGTFDGENFDIEIPYLYTSIQELKADDVFQLEEPHEYYRHPLDGKSSIKIDPSTKLVIESAYGLNRPVGARELDTNKSHRIHGDLKVKKIGKVEYIMKFVEESV